MKARLVATAALGAALVPASSVAQISCAALGEYLAAHPNVSQYVAPNGTVSPLVALTATAPNARCEAAFIYSARGGIAHGYAEGQNQRIGLRVGLPLNSVDGGAGGVEGTWNGKVMNLGGGGRQGEHGAGDAGSQNKAHRFLL